MNYLKSFQVNSSQLPISDLERDLIFKILDGYDQGLPFIYMWRSLWHKAKDVPYIEALEWLVRNKITGQKFVQWITIEQEKNTVNAMAFLRKKICRDLEKKKVFRRLI